MVNFSHWTFLQQPSLLTSLLSCRPQSVRDILGHDSTGNCDRLPILSYFDGVQLLQRDLNTICHLPESGDRSVNTICRKEGQRLAVCKLYLSRGRRVSYHRIL